MTSAGITIPLLDALDRRFDLISHNAYVSGGMSEVMQRDYWTMRRWIDARRNELQPFRSAQACANITVIYPEPAPVMNCPHPPDRDYCGEWFDPERGEMRLWRGCRICGEVWDMPPIKRAVKKPKKSKKAKKQAA